MKFTSCTWNPTIVLFTTCRSIWLPKWSKSWIWSNYKVIGEDIKIPTQSYEFHSTNTKQQAWKLTCVPHLYMGRALSASFLPIYLIKKRIKLAINIDSMSKFQAEGMLRLTKWISIFPSNKKCSRAEQVLTVLKQTPSPKPVCPWGPAIVKRKLWL